MSRTTFARRMLRKRAVRIALPIIAALAIAGGAFAYFTSTGSGAGSSSAGSTQNVTISAATPTAALYPGGTGDLAATVGNPNSISVHLPLLSLDTSQGTNGFSVDPAHATAGCSAAAAQLSFTSQNDGGAGWDVPPRVGATNGTLSLDLANAVSMGIGSASACQGATFTVFLKVGS